MASSSSFRPAVQPSGDSRGSGHRLRGSYGRAADSERHEMILLIIPSRRPAKPGCEFCSRFSRYVYASGGRTLRVQARTQIVSPMLSCVTAG